jgi:hypothetical protein
MIDYLIAYTSDRLARSTDIKKPTIKKTLAPLHSWSVLRVGTPPAKSHNLLICGFGRFFRLAYPRAKQNRRRFALFKKRVSGSVRKGVGEAVARRSYTLHAKARARAKAGCKSDVVTRSDFSHPVPSHHLTPLSLSLSLSLLTLCGSSEALA